jgi:hypothetical protein
MDAGNRPDYLPSSIRVCLLRTSDVAAVRAVSVTLDEISRSCARARSNHGALLSTNQASAYRADDSTDDGALRFAVMMSVGPAVSHAVHRGSQDNKNEHQQHRDYVLLSDILYH